MAFESTVESMKWISWCGGWEINISFTFLQDILQDSYKRFMGWTFGLHTNMMQFWTHHSMRHWALGQRQLYCVAQWAFFKHLFNINATSSIQHYWCTFNGKIERLHDFAQTRGANVKSVKLSMHWYYCTRQKTCFLSPLKVLKQNSSPGERKKEKKKDKNIRFRLERKDPEK